MTKSRGLRAPKGTRTRWVSENQGRHLCGCGCGEPVQLRPEQYPTPPRFLHGHNTTITHRRAVSEPAPCACGCGAEATPGRRFRSGHNSRGRELGADGRAKIRAAMTGERNHRYGRPAHNRKPPTPQRPCLCGCGELATTGRNYRSGHNQRGARMSNFTGRYLDSGGYVRIWQPGHPFANRDGYVLEHRVIAEIHLRATDPDGPYLVRLGDQLYLRPDLLVHFDDGDRLNLAVDNLVVMTNSEHTALHHARGDILG